MDLKFIKPIFMSNYITNDLFNNIISQMLLTSVVTYIHRYTYQPSMNILVKRSQAFFTYMNFKEFKFTAQKMNRKYVRSGKPGFQGNQTQKMIVS
jgi:hypothetical protein